MEVFLNTGGGATIRYAIQAKKLYPDKGYIHQRQSGQERPLSNPWVLSPSICCSTTLTRKRVDVGTAANAPSTRNLGCTLVWYIRAAIRHVAVAPLVFCIQVLALPLRCRFDCPHLPWELNSRRSRVPRPSISAMYASNPKPYSWVNFEPREGDWPEWLWAQNQRIISVGGERAVPRIHERNSSSIGFCWLDRT